MKYDANQLNILDAEKKTPTLKSGIQLENKNRNYSYIFVFLLCGLVSNKFREEGLCFFFLKVNWEINFMTSLLVISLFELDNI